MLTKITLDNFKSFKNKTVVDLTKTNYTILPQNVADNGVLKGCVFVGANASGKSTIILAVKLLLDLLFSERNINSGMFLCMFGDTNKYSLSYEFLIENKTISYSFEVDVAKKMISESLYIDNELLLQRMGLSAKSYIADSNGINYDEEDVGKDSLFLRTLYFNTKFASNSTLGSWMDYLKKSFYVNMFKGEIVSYGKRDMTIATYLDNGGCDVINNFFDEYNFEQKVEFVHRTSGGKISFVAGEDEDVKTVFFKRKGIEVPIPFFEESLGNQNLLRILPVFLSAINNGGMLLIDEFSSGFHNELESLLVRYFMEKTNLLSNSILRPDQEYSVEFQDQNGSTVKRFSSEQPRSAQNIEKMYVSGVFGGLPEYSCKTK